MSEEETILGVSVGKIKSRRNLLGTWRYFGGSTKYNSPCRNRQEFNALGVSDLEVAEYILYCESKKQRSNAIKAADEAMSVQEEKDWLEDRKDRERKGGEEHERRYQEYLQDFNEDALTEADKASIWTLVGIDLALKENVKAQYSFYGRVDPGSIMNKKLLSDEVARMSAEFRQLQKMLGIDMPTRIKAEQQATGIDVVRDIVDQSAEFISNEMIEVEHCGILNTWLCPFFPEMGYRYETKCPRCGEAIIVEEAEYVPPVQDWLKEE